MKVTLRYFASIREALGAVETVELEEGATMVTIASVREALIARGGAHAIVLARGRAIRCAMNQVVCDESAVVAEGTELAFFPPVTGG